MRCDDRGGGTHSSSPRTDHATDRSYGAHICDDGHGARSARCGGGTGDSGALEAVAMAAASPEWSARAILGGPGTS